MKDCEGPMNRKQRDHLERRLLRERERAVQALVRLDESARAASGDEDGDLTRTPFHPADEGTDTIEQETEFVLMSKEGRLVYQIDEALRTLYRNPKAYGVCRDCGRAIAFDRLDIIPWAGLCLDCQRAAEEGPFRRVAA